MNTKFDGIVLYSKHSGEADVISKILTGEYGVIDILFKGIKKSIRRPHIATEPGVLSTFTLQRIFRDRVSIAKEIHVVDAHLPLREDIVKIAYMNFISEIVLKSCPPNQHDEYLFRLFKAVLSQLEMTTDVEYLSLFFLLRLFSSQGILPNFRACGICGSISGKTFHFSIKDKSILCPVCARIPVKDYFKNTAGHRLFIKMSLSEKYAAVKKDIISVNEALDLLYHLVLYAENYLGIGIKTKSFIFSNFLMM